MFVSPELALRFPSEIEIRRGGTDEGKGRGFDKADPSADAWRTISAGCPAEDVTAWFRARLIELGWNEDKPGWFTRGRFETFVVRPDIDLGVSRVGSAIADVNNRKIQEDFERRYYAGAPQGWSVVTLSYIVAPEERENH
jgi:hypothetical protein